jgi:hypothetical protein
MPAILEYTLSAVVGLALLATGLFFTAFPGWQYIQVHRYLKGLKAEFEPIARAVGAKTKIEWVTEKAQVMYFFEFPSEQWMIESTRGNETTVNAWLTLEVGSDGYNIYVPSFTPPKQMSQDYAALVNAITRHRASEIGK